MATKPAKPDPVANLRDRLHDLEVAAAELPVSGRDQLLRLADLIERFRREVSTIQLREGAA